jgi:hypothetical protein
MGFSTVTLRVGDPVKLVEKIQTRHKKAAFRSRNAIIFAISEKFVTLNFGIYRESFSRCDIGKEIKLKRGEPVDSTKLFNNYCAGN